MSKNTLKDSLKRSKTMTKTLEEFQDEFEELVRYLENNKDEKVIVTKNGTPFLIMTGINDKDN